MAQKKTIIETNAHRVHGTSLSLAVKDIEAGLLLAMELQNAGVMLTPQVLGSLTMRSEYDPSALRHEARIQVPAKFGEPDVSWETVVAAAARGETREQLLSTVTLEQLHKLRSKVNERINEVEKRLRDESDHLPQF